MLMLWVRLGLVEGFLVFDFDFLLLLDLCFFICF